MNSIRPKSDPRPRPSWGGGLLRATGQNSNVDRGAWPSPRSGWPGGLCHLGVLVRAHGRCHNARDQHDGVAGAACRRHAGRQGPRESVIEGRASRRAWKQGGELATGAARQWRGGVGRDGAFTGREMLQRSSVPLCGSCSKVRRRGRWGTRDLNPGRRGKGAHHSAAMVAAVAQTFHGGSGSGDRRTVWSGSVGKCREGGVRAEWRRLATGWKERRGVARLPFSDRRHTRQERDGGSGRRVAMWRSRGGPGHGVCSSWGPRTGVRAVGRW
jgi:hypothetical protein